MNFLRFAILVSMSALLTNCTSTQNKDGVIETSTYVLDLGNELDGTKTLTQEASSTEKEDSE